MHEYVTNLQFIHIIRNLIIPKKQNKTNIVLDFEKCGLLEKHLVFQRS